MHFKLHYWLHINKNNFYKNIFLTQYSLRKAEQCFLFAKFIHFVQKHMSLVFEIGLEGIKLITFIEVKE